MHGKQLNVGEVARPEEARPHRRPVKPEIEVALTLRPFEIALVEAPGAQQ
jgi:hypothetical protein